MESKMKRYMDYTDEEILNMSTGDLEGLVNLECAIEGVKILDEPKDVEPLSVLPDVTVYEFDGFYSTDKKAIEQIQELATKLFDAGKLVRTDYDYRTSNYTHKYVEPLSSLGSMSSSKVYSKKAYAELTAELVIYNNRKKAYEADYSEYRESVAKRKTCSNWVMDYFNDIVAKRDGLNRMREQFKQYLSLANGDREIAWNFLEKAYPSQTANREEIMEEVK